MDQPKLQLVDKLKTANCVLVTVGRNPSVDQLAALIGMTLLINKTGKHAAAVFSGEVPSTLEFLKPEETIEKNTDSLRDFIIALDKSKADKLRYKVEDDVVRIFITPYRSSISQSDLDFSQGDFNVDVVVALGVTKQEDLDEAIMAHGRILHDATVTTITIEGQSDLGSIHWQEPQASSLSELVTKLARLLGDDLLDTQIATALLTGIVAETDRFSNVKTTADVMSASAILMAAGANQQLVASKLAQQLHPTEPERSAQAETDVTEPAKEAAQDSPENVQREQAEDGAIEIEHDNLQTHNELTDPAPESEQNLQAPAPELDLPQIISLPEKAVKLDEPAAELDTYEVQAETLYQPPTELSLPSPDRRMGGSRLITEPPTMGGQLTANSHVEVLEPSSDPLSAPASNRDVLLSRPNTISSTPIEPELQIEPEQAPVVQTPVGNPYPPMITGLTPPPPAWVTPQENPLDLPDFVDTKEQTLTELEAAVHSQPDSLDAARDEVSRALNSDPTPFLPPVEALNAQPLLDNLNSPQPGPGPTLPNVVLEASTDFIDNMQQKIPSLPVPPSVSPAFVPPQNSLMPSPNVIDPNAAPPVPPPIPFNFGAPPNQQ